MSKSLNILKSIRENISSEIEIISDGVDSYEVITPFYFDDGDMYTIRLEKSTFNNWYFTDEGNTFMRLSYEMDVNNLTKEGRRFEIVNSVVNSLDIQNSDGELISNVQNEEYGKSLYNLIQCITRINDISFLSRENVKSTFIEDFKSFINSELKDKHFEFDHHIPKYDIGKKYPVDCMINSVPNKKPLFLFAINSDSKCKDVTINILQYQKWDIAFKPIAIFEDQTNISRNVLARFSDVGEKQYSSLYSNKEGLAKQFKEFYNIQNF